MVSELAPARALRQRRQSTAIFVILLAVRECSPSPPDELATIPRCRTGHRCDRKRFHIVGGYGIVGGVSDDIVLHHAARYATGDQAGNGFGYLPCLLQRDKLARPLLP